jgi:hypothetical protein
MSSHSSHEYIDMTVASRSDDVVGRHAIAIAYPHIRTSAHPHARTPARPLVSISMPMPSSVATMLCQVQLPPRYEKFN